MRSSHLFIAADSIAQLPYNLNDDMAKFDLSQHQADVSLFGNGRSPGMRVQPVQHIDRILNREWQGE